MAFQILRDRFLYVVDQIGDYARQCDDILPLQNRQLARGLGGVCDPTHLESFPQRRITFLVHRVLAVLVELGGP